MGRRRPWGVQPEDSDHHLVDSGEEVPQFRVCRQGLLPRPGSQRGQAVAVPGEVQDEAAHHWGEPASPWPHVLHIREPRFLQPFQTLGALRFLPSRNECPFTSSLEVEHMTLLWNTQHFLTYTRAGRYSEYLATCLLRKLTSQTLPGWSTGIGGWETPAVPGDPPSPAGLLGDQGILKEGLGDEGAFWGLRVVVITNRFGSNNQQQ